MTIGKYMLLLAACLAWQVYSGAYANSLVPERSIVGDWQTIDHDLNKPSSIIHIWKDKDRYFGKIKKVYPGHPNALVRCVGCRGWQHNAPILGLLIIGSLIEGGHGQYEEGRILDPRTGKIYRCRAQLSQDGRWLKVRAYLGFSMIGITDKWSRYPAR